MAMTAAREAAEILQEKELKDSQRREAKQYAAHLQAIVGRLAADESIRNAAYKAEEDAEWAKKEAGWKREEDQRKRLWDRVHEERQQQLFEKGEPLFLLCTIFLHLPTMLACTMKDPFKQSKLLLPQG